MCCVCRAGGREERSNVTVNKAASIGGRTGGNRCARAAALKVVVPQLWKVLCDSFGRCCAAAWELPFAF